MIVHYNARIVYIHYNVRIVQKQTYAFSELMNRSKIILILYTGGIKAGTDPLIHVALYNYSTLNAPQHNPTTIKWLTGVKGHNR